MRARLIDVSSNQVPAALPWERWRVLGFEGAYRRVCLGTWLDPTADEHRRRQRLAGYLTGGYAALHERDPMEAQCQVFLDHLAWNDELPAAADCERRGLTVAMLLAWFGHWDEHCQGRRLAVYTGYPFWQRIVQAGRAARFERYELWIAAYPFDRPDYDEQGRWQGQVMTAAAVAARSSPPVGIDPLIPAPWVQPDAWQHTGHGRLVGYERDLDLSVSAYESNTFRLRYTRPMTKLMPHVLGTSGEALAYVRATRGGFIKLVGDFGAAREYKGLGCTVIGRRVWDDEPQPMNADWLAQPPAECARRLYAERYRADVLANPSVDAWEGPNEVQCKPNNLDRAADWEVARAAMAWYGLFEAERVKLLEADGKGAVVGNFSTGQPEPELWPLFYPAIAALVVPGRWLGLHEYGSKCQTFDTYNLGRFTRAPKEVRKLITETGTDGIKPTAECPGGQAWTLEFSGDGAAYARWLYAYDQRLQMYPDVDAAFIFTSGQGWPLHNLEDHGVLAALADLVGAVPWPEEDDMDVTKLRALAQQMKAEATTLSGLADQMLADLVEAPWWQVTPLPFVALAVANPLLTYVSPGGSIYDSRVNVAYDLNVTDRVTVDGVGWLKVSSKPLWVKAEDCRLKSA